MRARSNLRWSIALGVLVGCTTAAAVDIPDSAVLIDRLAYQLPNGLLDTRNGSLQIDLIRLRHETGIAQGYINVATAQGWAVKNLLVLDGERFPYQALATPIDLGSTTDISVIARIDYSPTLATTFALTPNRTLPVGRRVIDTGSADTTPNTAAPGPPNRSGLNFDASALLKIAAQYDHRSIEGAKNAGWPTAAANSLDRLRLTTPMPLPHEHRPGLEGDNSSLVGFMGLSMRRNSTSRREGSPVVDPLAGKLDYIARAGLHTSTESTHHGLFGSVVGNTDVRVNVAGREAISIHYDGIISPSWLIEASFSRTSCEAVTAWPGGSRVFNVAGAGTLGGNPFVFSYFDTDESTDDALQRTRPINLHFLTGPDVAGVYGLDGSNETLRALTCTRVLPLPSDSTVTNTIDPGGHTGFVAGPPSRFHVDEFADIFKIYTPTGANEWYGSMLGRREADGTLRGSSTTTIAGRPNVLSEFVGRRDGLTTTGRFTVGVRGELNNVPISWDVRAVQLAEPPRAHMRVNGYSGDVTVEAGSLAQFSVGAEPGRLSGQLGEFWLVAQLADDSFYSYDPFERTWKPGLRPVISGTLSDVPAYVLLPLEGLPAGTYDLYFGYDTRVDATPNLDSLVYQRTTLRVVPEIR